MENPPGASRASASVQRITLAGAAAEMKSGNVVLSVPAESEKPKCWLSQRILPAQLLGNWHMIFDNGWYPNTIYVGYMPSYCKLLYLFVVKLDEISWCLHSTLFEVGTHYHCSVLGQFDVGFHRQTTCSRWPVIRLQPNDQKWGFDETLHCQSLTWFTWTWWFLKKEISLFEGLSFRWTTMLNFRGLRFTSLVGALLSKDPASSNSCKGAETPSKITGTSVFPSHFSLF